MNAEDGDIDARAIPPGRRIALAVLLVVLFAGFLALGTWQVERRTWKLNLIARVDARVHAAPVPAPGPEAWPDVTAKNDEYRRVSLEGHFLNDEETPVYTANDSGPGYWIVTPFERPNGTYVLVNRGFVPNEKKKASSRPKGEIEGDTRVVGLMRMSQPGGAFLRSNKPAEGRWYSRDVEAIAKARGLPRDKVAPYFVDAGAAKNPGGLPVGGLTRIHFRNAHLVYALTWYTLALMTAGALVTLFRGRLFGKRKTISP
ncbi:SURF1 family protein [Pararhizobium mangrovi]|uniref:SURF1-like protein n=1 Tax=Pararhizobium mangrovi TaxID=2590452 RepID=A0A506U1K2_9HYPH|nr:SURF1 family protein [Pararhizobium mangrovi]TPW26835.1 SURF1 family protein [Pararhizobium mangrovi]